MAVPMHREAREQGGLVVSSPSQSPALQEQALEVQGPRQGQFSTVEENVV